MRNPLDSVWLKPLLILLLFSIPASIALVNPKWFNPFTVIWYGLVLAIASETIATFEHANGHYHFFRLSPQAKLVDRAAFASLRLCFEYLLDLMLARIPRWYGVEHVLVHHAEDNGPADLQSTLPYDRASFIDFARCANRFALSGMLPLDVLHYLWQNHRMKGMTSLLAGMSTFYGTLGLLGLWNWRAALVLLAFRYANLVKGAMSFFQEHGLVDIAEPLNIYRNSLHYINRGNTHASLGEDPHIEHHLHPGRHWSEYIDAVGQDLDRYADEKAVGFLDGSGQVTKYYRLMWQRRYMDLANMFVLFGAPDATQQEVAALLEARTRPLTGEPRSMAFHRMDLAVGRLAGYLLP